MKKVVVTVLLLALLGGAGLALMHKRESVAARPAAAIPPVVVDKRTLVAGPVSLTLPTTAEVLPLREAVLASRASAYVVELTRFEGDIFEKGEVLARLDASQAQADLNRAEATLAETRLRGGALDADLVAARSLVDSEEARLARLVALHKIGDAALEPRQAAESALAAARARLVGAEASRQGYDELLAASQAQAQAARENLRYTVIAAPFDGVVSQRLAQAGDLAVPGKPLLKIMDPSAGVRLLVSAPQAIHPAALLVAGERLALNPWPEATGQGLARFEARGDLRLLPGAQAAVRLEVFRADRAILVSRACLLGDDGRAARLLRLNGGQPTGIEVAIAAQGEEGVALADTALAGVEILCASPDILTRAQAGTPVTTVGPNATQPRAQ